MTKRSMVLVAALILALVATAALASYVRGIEEETLRDAEAVKALVAKDLIAAGTSGAAAASGGLIVDEAIPRRLVSEDIVTSLDEITDLVADVDILKGEQIRASRFVSAQAQGRIPIPKGRQAMSVEVAIPPGVAGFVKTGDRVSILAQLDVPVGGEAQSQPRVQFMLQSIEVLAVGRSFSNVEGDGDTPPAVQQQVLLTLAVTPSEAEKLGFAVFQGQVYFTLLPEGQKPTNTPGRTSTNAFS